MPKNSGARAPGSCKVLDVTSARQQVQPTPELSLQLLVLCLNQHSEQSVAKLTFSLCTVICSSLSTQRFLWKDS